MDVIASIFCSFVFSLDFMDVRVLCQVLFIYIDINDEDNLRVLEFFGLKPEDVPTLRIIELEEDLVKYRPPSLDLSVSGVQQFVQDYLDGKLKVRVPCPCLWLKFV